MITMRIGQGYEVLRRDSKASYAHGMARVTAAALVFVLVGCSSASTTTTEAATTTLPDAPTTTAAAPTTTSTAPAPVRRVEVTAPDEVPDEIVTALAAMLSEAVDDRNPSAEVPQGMRSHFAGAELPDRVDVVTFATAELPDRGTVGIGRTAAGDVVLAADEGTGWQLVGARFGDVGAWYGDTPRMVLVLGSDARPGQDPLRFHSDSIHVVTARPAERTGAILGWPRDSYVETPYGSMKITALMVNRGPAVVRDHFREDWDLPVEGYVVTGFRGFQELVAAIGRILIDIPQALPTQEWFPGFAAGEQWLSPIRALDFARTRKGVPGGDLTRSKNQGLLMLAALRMLHQYEIEAVLPFIVALTEHADTDLTATQLVQLAASAMELDPDAIGNDVLPGRVGRTAGASVVFLDPEADDLVDDLRDDGLLDD